MCEPRSDSENSSNDGIITTVPWWWKISPNSIPETSLSESFETVEKPYTGYYKIISFPDGFVPPSNTDELDETQLPNGERVFLQYI